MLVAALALSGCGSEDYKAAFEAFMTAQSKCDKEAMLELVPPALYDYYYNKEKLYTENKGEEVVDEEIKEAVNKRFGPLVFKMDAIRFDKDIDFNNDFSFDYKITDTKKASSSELKEFNSYLKDHLGFTEKAQDVVLIKYTYTMKCKGEVSLGMEDITSMGAAVKMDGKWYYVDSTAGGSIMWTDGFGLVPEVCVQWAFDWFRDN